MKPKKIIYKVTCTITNEVYVGATTKSVEERQKDHEQKAEKGTGHYFHEAIATFGPEQFKWEQIDTANDVNELAEKEKEYILRYNSKVEGYNGDSGGGIKKKVYQYKVDDKSCIRTFDSLEEAAKAVGAKRTSISNACLGYNKSCKGFYWSYSKAQDYSLICDRRKKKVIQLSLPGSIIARFDSVAEASRAVGLSKSCIARCCRGEREQSGGYRWAYETTESTQNKTLDNGKF
ncbi:NUMOD1 domain-containing DNA-binding protein [Maribacter luteus]|uniref:Endonuclease n=1 Tax=Maribacter luteus TaxID=2594478 RepID=A0A6I2MPD6_9FLAO|nr:NUMOD1 domain-containing DNA-binding protein [Maribacter luteus]MRX64380.1 endonuclease [Maribacter luteus]